MEPRVFDGGKVKKPEELLRMPKFTSRPRRPTPSSPRPLAHEGAGPPAAQKRLSADERYVEKGRRLVRNYNCQACHRSARRRHLPGDRGGPARESGGDILQAAALTAPILYNEKSKVGEGSRVHTDWLHGFLDRPENKVRPWLELRMPSFQFDEEQRNTITRYFAAQDGVAYPYEPKPPRPRHDRRRAATSSAAGSA